MAVTFEMVVFHYLSTQCERDQHVATCDFCRVSHGPHPLCDEAPRLVARIADALVKLRTAAACLGWRPGEGILDAKGNLRDERGTAIGPPPLLKLAR